MTKPKSGIHDGQLTQGQKAEIVAYAAKCPNTNNVKIAQWATKTFRLSKPLHRTTVGRILKRKHEFENLTNDQKLMRHRRNVAHPAVEEALVNWVLLMAHQRKRVSMDIIKAKGREFATRILDATLAENFKFSNGWYQSFCQRNGLGLRNIHGESGDAEMENIEEKLNQIKASIKCYALEDIYNMDETAYLYNLAPDKTIAQRQIEGSKKDKTRLTIALTCNATGTDRFELLFLGHAVKPRCFNKKSGREHGFYYMSNKKAWMTAQFFQDFLLRFNNHVNRKVLLLIDNAPSHIWENLRLSNVEVVALPPNTTSKLQPLDAGIIAAFKCHIRRRQLVYALDALESNKNPYKVDQLTAMRWARAAWLGLEPSVIQNCWRHTGLTEVKSC
jgi:DDE superfamily endonuclease/Tc5 transposase DNA-binding domain